MAQVEQSYAKPGRNEAGFAQGDGARAILRALNALLADSFALYLKTKNFHWHVVGPNFRPYHLLFDEHAEELFQSTDELAERVRELGGCAPASEIGALRRVMDKSHPFARPSDMVSTLIEDNSAMAEAMREARRLCARSDDTASARLLETLIGQAERRRWFLFELRREAEDGA